MDESIKAIYDTVFYWANMARFATLFHVRKVNHYWSDYVSTFKKEYDREMNKPTEHEGKPTVHSPSINIIEDTTSNIMNNEKNQRLMDDFLIFPRG